MSDKIAGAENLARFSLDPLTGFQILGGRVYKKELEAKADFENRQVDRGEFGYTGIGEYFRRYGYNWCDSCMANVREIGSQKAQEVWENVDVWFAQAM